MGSQSSKKKEVTDNWETNVLMFGDLKGITHTDRQNSNHTRAQENERRYCVEDTCT